MQLSDIVRVSFVMGMLVIVYGAEISVLLHRFLARRHGILRKTSWKARSLHVVCVGGLACFLYSWVIEPSWLDVTSVTISTEKLRHTRLTVVHFSDLHCESHMRRIDTALMTRIKELQPDLLVFTGDAVNTPAGIPTFRHIMSELQAPLGKYAVRGNYDLQWLWERPSLDVFAGTGFALIDTNQILVEKDGESVALLGLSLDASPEVVAERFAQISEERYTIILCHYPDFFEQSSTFFVDLYLTGHMHGGQVVLPGLGALVRYGSPYIHGEYQRKATYMYVNRGIGMRPGRMFRMRFQARPEITVFDIIPKTGSTDTDARHAE